VDRPRFEALVSEFGVAAAGDVARHAMGGEPIAVDSTGLGPAWVLRTRAVPRPEPGFDVAASTIGRRAVGVDPEGPAFAAGLREGMTIVRVDNPPGATPGAPPDTPMTVVVRQGEAERALTFAPRVDQAHQPYFERHP
jgi:hypothetical protein